MPIRASESSNNARMAAAGAHSMILGLAPKLNDGLPHIQPVPG